MNIVSNCSPQITKGALEKYEEDLAEGSPTAPVGAAVHSNSVNRLHI